MQIIGIYITKLRRPISKIYWVIPVSFRGHPVVSCLFLYHSVLNSRPQRLRHSNFPCIDDSGQAADHSCLLRALTLCNDLPQPFLHSNRPALLAWGFGVGLGSLDGPDLPSASERAFKVGKSSGLECSTDAVSTGHVSLVHSSKCLGFKGWERWDASFLGSNLGRGGSGTKLL